MSRRTASGILGSRSVGLCASIAAAVVHYRLLADPLYRSVCDFNATWSCTQVYESVYGAFWGVPVAVGGVVWFTAVTLLARRRLARGRRPPGRQARWRAVWPATCSAQHASDSRRCSISRTRRSSSSKTYCLFCFITYFAVAGLFLVAGAAADGTMTGLPRRVFGDAARAS